MLFAQSLLPSMSVVKRYTGQAPNNSGSTRYALTLTFSPKISTSVETLMSFKNS